MTREYLEFEEPIAQIERQILELESAGDLSADDISSEIEVLNKSIIKIFFLNMSLIFSIKKPDANRAYSFLAL